MDVSDILIVGVEASVALAGFSGILATFQFRDTKSVRRTDVVALTTIVYNSLWCAFACSVPLVLSSFDIAETNIWLGGSLFAAVLMSGLIVTTVRGLHGAVSRRSTIVFFTCLQLVSATLVLLNVMNAADVVFHREPGPYLVSLLWGLSLAAYMFTRLLLRPLWFRIRRQENGFD